MTRGCYCNAFDALYELRVLFKVGLINDKTIKNNVIKLIFQTIGLYVNYYSINIPFLP